jgi:hypothetical protein
MDFKNIYSEFIKQLRIFVRRPIQKEEYKKNVSNWFLFFSVLAVIIFTILAYLFTKIRGNY